VAWKSIWAAKRLQGSEEFFNCGRCFRQEKDTKNDCPKCELSISTGSLRKNIKREAIKLYGIGLVYRMWPFDFDLEYVLEVYSLVSDMLADNNDQRSRKWDEALYKMATIILEERSQARAEMK
jgi:hypothetical protein